MDRVDERQWLDSFRHWRGGGPAQRIWHTGNANAFAFCLCRVEPVPRYGHGAGVQRRCGRPAAQIRLYPGSLPPQRPRTRWPPLGLVPLWLAKRGMAEPAESRSEAGMKDLFRGELVRFTLEEPETSAKLE